MADLDVTIPSGYRDHLRVGTCSWKFDSWKGLVYQKGMKYASDGYLPDYARLFSTVEVDQWFWSLFPGAPIKLPDEGDVTAYAESVPDDFVFSVKAPNAITLTHYYGKQSARYAEYANKPNDHFLSVDVLHRFLGRLAPMREKLGPVMLQFAYLNKKKMPSLGSFLEQLDAFFAAAPEGYQYAVEPRNPNYLKREFFDFLQERRIGFVFLDGYYMPPLGKVFDGADTFTSDFCVLRLHGPNREDIEKMTGHTWDSIVAPQERGLGSAVRIVRENTQRGVSTIVNANNHYEGSAPRTIERFLRMLADTDGGE
jgi:uncharacterized protein YecE (DUF72 family)